MSELRHIPRGEVEVTDGIIVYVGPTRSNHTAAEGVVTIDAGGKCLLPGFVDSHTHMVFGGWRADEFGWRMRGDSYMSIMERGGGIVNTVSATRSCSSAELEERTLGFLRLMSSMGVTTVEAKSGYGLDRESELRMLEVMQSLNAREDSPVAIDPTFMGAHAMPADFDGSSDDYIALLIDMLPEVKSRGLARHCDVFCEKGVFSIDQSRRLLLAARRAGLLPRMHADEIVNTGGAQLAAEIGALSADHLLHVSDEGIAALAASSTVATLLPLTAFTLREPYAPGRKLIDSGCAVALASDFNPGSCLSCSIPLLIALACIYMNFSAEEAVTALTLNGAAALGLADSIGSIEVGKQGDLVLLDFDSPAFLPYYTGLNCVALTIKGGRVVADNR